MVKKLASFFVLINFLNTPFFQAKASSTPVANQVNSFVEYLLEIVIGVDDSIPENEDDDVPDVIEIPGITDDLIHASLSHTIERSVIVCKTCFFYLLSKYNFSQEINAPPPKFS